MDSLVKINILTGESGDITMDKPNKAALAEEAYESAVNYELDYGCCPQCVLTAIQEAVGLVNDQTIKASHGLSGGGGLMGQGTCEIGRAACRERV